MERTEYRKILYRMKMIYALIKEKMLRRGVSGDETEKSSHSELHYVDMNKRTYLRNSPGGFDRVARMIDSCRCF